jgi:hypothetical protein
VPGTKTDIEDYLFKKYSKSNVQYLDIVSPIYNNRSVPNKLSHYFTFGKCKGYLIAEIVELDFQYLCWAVKNIDWFFIEEYSIEAMITKVDNIKRLKEILIKKEPFKPPTRVGKSHNPSNDYLSEEDDALNEAIINDEAEEFFERDEEWYLLNGDD